MFKRLISLIFASSLVFAQAPIVTVPTRAGQSTPLTVAQADSIGTTLQHQVNASQRTWGYNEIVSSGLVFAYYGGSAWNGTTYVNVADGNVTLAPSTTNYVQRTVAGVVTTNTTGFSSIQIPLYTVTTSASAITNIVDARQGAIGASGSTVTGFNGRTGSVVPTIGDYTASQINWTAPWTGAVTSTVSKKLQNTYDVVADFNAKGDGVTDDTSAIQAALTAAANGGTVLFPQTTSNTYLVSMALKFYSGETMKGAGGVGINTGGTIIRLTASSTSVIEPNTPGTTTQGFGAEGIYFDAQGNAPCAIKFFNTSHSTLKNIGANCTTASGAAILLDANVSQQTYFNVLENCRVYGIGTGGAGIRFQNGANANTVIGGKAGSGNYYGLDLLSLSAGNNVFGMDIESATAAAVHVDASTNVFTGLHIEACPIGFQITSNGNQTAITNPTMATSVTTPISDASILGARIYGMPDTTAAFLRSGAFNVQASYLSGSTTWDFDPGLNSGTANGIIHWLKNTNTSGTKQFTIYNGDGTSNFGFLYSPNTGLLSCTAFATANSIVAASGDFRLKSTGTIKFRNNANSADLTLVSKNASDQGLFGDTSSTNMGQGTWSFGSGLGINVASTTSRNFVWQTGGVSKWIWQVTGGETGSNAGADMSFLRRDDSGNAIDTPFSIVRAGGGAISMGGSTNSPVILTGFLSTPVGGSVASAATITPTAATFHVTGTTQINTINIPFSGFTGTIRIIPDGAFPTGTSGNIALASTAVVGRVLEFVYDGTKWYPSY